MALGILHFALYTLHFPHMHSLSLYKIPFRPHDRPGLWRFLLELDSDFYLYLYLEEPDGLHSFQIIRKESIVVTFFANRITVGRIDSVPFNRVIAEDSFCDEMKEIREFLSQVKSDELPQTLELIKTAVLEPFGPGSPRLRIPAKEARFLRHLQETPGKESFRSL